MQHPKYFDLVAMAFVAVLLITHVTAQKLFAFGPFTFTAGIIVFPLAYIFGDVLTEVYGYARSRRVIWAGFGASVLMIVVLHVAVALPPAENWPFQEQFSTVFMFVPRIVAASLVAYLCGEFLNSYVLARMKVAHEGQHLWKRTIGSTLVGQAADTAVFVVVAFAGVLPVSVLVATSISGYIFKVVYEVVATPLTYRVVGFLKDAEQVDTFDRDVDFSPFSLRT